MNVFKKPLFYFFSLLVAVSLSLAFSSYDNLKRSNLIFDYNVYALPIPENLNFSEEPLPLYLPDIRERMDRELLVNTYWQSNSLLLFKRAHKYFPIIEPILEQYGIPEDFKYLAVIESGLQNVTSPAGAKGFWQIMIHESVQVALDQGLECLLVKAHESAVSFFEHLGFRRIPVTDEVRDYPYRLVRSVI